FWVDQEYNQELYARIELGHEPIFYRYGETEKRNEWRARLQLARAAYAKKQFAAQPEKMANNSDLTTMTTEQLQTLYDIEGTAYGPEGEKKEKTVRRAMEWYVKNIVDGIEERVTSRHKGKNGKYRELVSIVECEFEDEFIQFRERLQNDIKREILGVSDEMEKAWEKEANDGNKEAEIKLRQLRFDAKSADAVAWNFIWVTNLVERLDSRYEREGNLNLRERHGNLIGLVCSDDFRAAYHPQERWEDKVIKSPSEAREWGAYSSWAIEQMARIREQYPKTKDEEIKIEPARKKRDFWMAKKTGNVLTVYVPEVFPVMTIKDFLGWAKEEEKESKSILDKLLAGDKINWKNISQSGMPWAANYITTQFSKMINLLEIYRKGRGDASAAEVAIALSDIFKVTKMKKRLIDYYKETSKGEAHFHNLKVYAYSAALGGVGRDGSRQFTLPFEKTALSSLFVSKRKDEARYLRHQIAHKYLDKGEDLEIRDIK
ncbi:MAG: hypothetical protein XD98_0458, partial [Microgenomates bacterium 39_6]